MTFSPGEIIGDYEILGPLGKGGMGAVYRVRNVVSDRVEALKEVLSGREQTPDLAERFLREIRVHATLQHPNIAQLFTAFRRDNQLLMIMELVEGVSLEEILHRGPMPAGDAADCMAQTLEALRYAHAHGVIHRDIKPANIVVLPEGVVKLLDFGIARGETDRRLTLSGMVIGSLSYMSPEQVDGQCVDGRSDIYSVGVTLYQAVAGMQPFQGESQYAVMHAQRSHTPAAPGRLNPEIPAGLSEAIMRSLEKEPARRFQTAADFQAALEPFRSGGTRAALARDPAAGVPGPGPSRSSSQVDSSARQVIARKLAQFVGPIAQQLVESRSRAAASTEDLCRSLAGEIATESDRAAFLHACREQLPWDAPRASTSSTYASPTAIDPALIECARRELAAYVGPLAKVIVTRALKKAGTADELIAMLGTEIERTPDRERFFHVLRHFGQ
jgi:serine/threonine protein kinase